MYMFIFLFYSGAGKDRKKKNRAKWRELNGNKCRKQDKHVQETEGKGLLQFIYEAWWKLNPYRSRPPRQQGWGRRQEKKGKTQRHREQEDVEKETGKCYESIKDRRGEERENKFYLEVNNKHSRKECSGNKDSEEIINTSRERHSTALSEEEMRAKREIRQQQMTVWLEQNRPEHGGQFYDIRWATHLILSVCRKSQQRETAANVKQLRKRKRKETSPGESSSSSSSS